MVTVACVLRSGGDFTARHVYALRLMLDEHLPGRDLACLTDVQAVDEPCLDLAHDWPGWWAKMELCRPGITGPLFFLDLDTILVGDLTPLLTDTSRSIVLRDVYRGRRDPWAVQSSLMLLTEADRAAVWDAWIKDPEGWMGRKHSDQDVYEAVLKDRVGFWQDTHPGMVVSYKAHLNGNEPHPETRVVIFHGKPRPWDSEATWARDPFAIAG